MHARWLSCQNEPWFKQQANMHVWVQLAQATSSTHEQSMLRASESHTNSWGWAPGWLLRRLRLRLGRTVLGLRRHRGESRHRLRLRRDTVVLVSLGGAGILRLCCCCCLCLLHVLHLLLCCCCCLRLLHLLHLLHKYSLALAAPGASCFFATCLTLSERLVLLPLGDRERVGCGGIGGVLG